MFLPNSSSLSFELGLRQLSSRLQAEGKNLGHPLHFRALMGSTNEEARRLTAQGARAGSVVIAGEQSSGRGRRGRTWVSPGGGNLYFSLILRPEIEPGRAYEFTLLAAVALADALRALEFQPRLKWPNDLELSGRKAAGILCELATKADGGIGHVVMGIGINVNAPLDSLSPEILERATSLSQEAGREIPLVAVVSSLLNSLESWLEIHNKKGLLPVLEVWRNYSSTLGQHVAVQAGDRQLEGLAEDLDDSGALLVRLKDGSLERVVAGEVASLRRQQTD